MFLFMYLQLDVAVQEINDDQVPIKRVLLLLDLAKQGVSEEDATVPIGKWTRVLQELSLS